MDDARCMAPTSVINSGLFVVCTFTLYSNSPSTCIVLLCSYKVEGDEQTAKAELRGLRVVTQINLGGGDASIAPKVFLTTDCSNQLLSLVCLTFMHAGESGLLSTQGVYLACCGLVANILIVLKFCCCFAPISHLHPCRMMTSVVTEFRAQCWNLVELQWI